MMFKKKPALITLSFILMLLACTPVFAASSESKKKEPGMLTTPPPAEYAVPYYQSERVSNTTGTVTPDSINPGDIYLDAGTSSIGTDASGNPVFKGDTSLVQKAQTVGCISELQKWDGSKWVTVDTVSATYPNFYYVSVSKTGTAVHGYYYRTYSTHTAVNYTYSEVGHSATPYKAF